MKEQSKEQLLAICTNCNKEWVDNKRYGDGLAFLTEVRGSERFRVRVTACVSCWKLPHVRELFGEVSY